MDQNKYATEAKSNSYIDLESDEIPKDKKIKMINVEMELLTRLQNWYQSECNEDWEHTFGFKLETLDNPGWTFEADLADTRWCDIKMNRNINQRSETDWVQYEITSSKYIACGGASNLIEMLQTFFDVLDDFDMKQV